MVAKPKPTEVKSSEHLVWKPIDNYAAVFALVIILGGFFMSVKAVLEGNDIHIQIAGGLFIVVGFTITRLLKLVSLR